MLDKRFWDKSSPTPRPWSPKARGILVAVVFCVGVLLPAGLLWVCLTGAVDEAFASAGRRPEAAAWELARIVVLLLLLGAVLGFNALVGYYLGVHSIGAFENPIVKTGKVIAAIVLYWITVTYGLKVVGLDKFFPSQY